MARTETAMITDDIDGSPSAQALRFGFQVQDYEIDLAPAGHAAYLPSLRPFISAARTVPAAARPMRASLASRHLAAGRLGGPGGPGCGPGIAHQQGIPLAGRGRIPGRGTG